MESRNDQIFREMQAADAIRATQNREGTRTLHSIYAGLQGALNDCYRRVFENGWYHKDLFDGRFHWDHQVRSPADGQFPREQLGQSYTQNASFYGWDKHQEPTPQPSQQQGMEYGYGMER